MMERASINNEGTLLNRNPNSGTASRDTVTDRVPTGVRSLYILEELTKAGVPMTPTEINETLALPKPTIHRLCLRLEQEGFLAREIDGKRYVPGPRLRSISAGISQFSSFRQARHAVLKRLSEEIGETCNITIPDKGGMVYLDRVETRWPLRVQFAVGSHVPFHCSASGKLYLSTLRSSQRHRLVASLNLEKFATNTITDPEQLLVSLERIRREKVGTDNEELVDGMVAIALPIEDKSGKFIATLAVHAPSNRMTFEEALEQEPLLRKATEKLRSGLSGVD